MRALLQRKFLAVFLYSISTIFGVLSLVLVHWDEKYEAVSGYARVIDKEVPSDLWFNSSGDLLGIFQGRSIVVLRRWHVSKGDPTPEERKLDFLLLSQSKVVRLEESGADKPDSLSVKLQPVEEKIRLVYAFSASGLKVAWVWSGRLNIAIVGRPAEPVVSFELQRNETVSSIQFVDDSLVSILFAGGRLAVFDLRGPRLGLAGVLLGKDWSLWTRGPFIAGASFPGQEVARIRVRGADNIDSAIFHVPMEKSTVLAASKTGRLALGTENGYVVFMPRDHGEDSAVGVALELPRPVRSLAFYDDSSVFAAGEFDNIFLVNDRLGAKVFLSAPGPMLRIASDDSYIAYGGQDLKVSHIERLRRLSALGVTAFVFALVLAFSTAGWALNIQRRLNISK